MCVCMYMHISIYLFIYLLEKEIIWPVLFKTVKVLKTKTVKNRHSVDETKGFMIIESNMVS